MWVFEYGLKPAWCCQVTFDEYLFHAFKKIPLRLQIWNGRVENKKWFWRHYYIANWVKCCAEKHYTFRDFLYLDFVDSINSCLQVKQFFQDIMLKLKSRELIVLGTIWLNPSSD